MSANMKKLEISDNIMIHFKLLEKQEQENPKSHKWKEIIKIGAEINEMETKNNSKNQWNKNPFSL
jgi:hypothetical protein